MVETEYMKFTKELEELQDIFTNYGERVDASSQVLQYHLTTEQRDILVLLLKEKQRAVAKPSLTEQFLRKGIGIPTKKDYEQRYS